MILVCGATGTIGGQVIRQLSASQIPVTALLRKPPSQKTPLPEGVPYVIGDLSHPETLPAALAGVDRLFLLSAVGEHQDEQELNLIQAAARAGVAHVVKLSVMGAASDASFSFGRLHARIEDALKASGLPWTMVRPNMMMQNLLWYRSAMALGVLPLPLQDSAVSHVDASDIAAVACRALTGTGHAGKTYVVTGPEALTGADVAAIISQATGKPIRYEPMSLSDFRAFLEKNGESPMVVDGECELFTAWSAGRGSEVTRAVREVTQTPPVTLAEFAARHAAELV